MKIKVMLGLAAVSLLASCGAIKTPQIELQNSKATVTPGSNGNGSGGALGIDGGKGAPLSLSKGGLVLQGTQTNKAIISNATFNDSSSKDLIDNLSKLAEWGFSQDMPTADLTGVANCPDTFSMTNASFTVVISDAPTSGARSVSKTVAVPTLTFTKATGCNYNATIAGGKAALASAISGTDLVTFGQIITQVAPNPNTVNTVNLTGTYTTDDTVAGGSLVINFGGSSSYVIATIL
jgi:hypothetical protein